MSAPTASVRVTRSGSPSPGKSSFLDRIIEDIGISSGARSAQSSMITTASGCREDRFSSDRVTTVATVPS